MQISALGADFFTRPGPGKDGVKKMDKNVKGALTPREIEAAYPPSKIFFDRFCEGGSLNRAESETLFDEIIRGVLSDIEITALLVSLKIKGETPEEIAGASNALRGAATDFQKPEYVFADSAGTGGDGSQTFNISTASAFLAAAAGLPIAKHGNRSVSSRSGSADVLEALGANIHLSPKTARQCLDNVGFTFLFAPQYHSGVKHVMKVRTELKTRTLFNILGPTVNPAHPPVQLVGVYDPALCRPVAETLKLIGCEAAMVVHGDGLDEIALHGPTKAVRVENGKIFEETLLPGDFGLEEISTESLEGGSAFDNARIIRNIFEGSGGDSQTAIVLANASALLFLSGMAENLKEGVKLAKNTLEAGKAEKVLSEFVRFSNQSEKENR